MTLQDKVALLCGVGQGMDRATALLFAQEGAKVAVVARRPEPLEGTGSRIQAQGGEAMALPGDASVKSDAERIVEDVMRRFGRIDVLYCGVGGFFEPSLDFSDVDEARWDQALSNTLTSLYNMTRAVRPVMREQGRGSHRP
jgi:NAD(P)-dependent dehydrogenase (short-subunit alcohol dehydrogenase family)